ncbi:MAG: biotin/lipoyl-binding protein, partial [Gammaproteobacteria bacterium]|nr:biotin/lipoyl-binding protein [Gammaproteobacteria bacterium]
MTSNSGRTPPPLSTSATGLKHWLRNHPKLMVTILVLAAAAWYTASESTDPATTGSAQTADGQLIATPVAVASARQDTLNVYLFGLGVVTPLNTVKVSSRVDGELLSVAFEEGQMVKAGDLLAQIDPVPFEVELKLASGQLERDKALLDKAKVDLERYNKLLEQDSISSQLVDTKESL